MQDWESFQEDMSLEDLVENAEDFLLHYQRLDLTAANCKTPAEKRAQSLEQNEQKKKKKEDDEDADANPRATKKPRSSKPTKR